MKSQDCENKKKRVFVGLSGGVDSSVAALLLLQEGYQVIGVTIDTGCGDAVTAAAKVARELEIEHRVLDLRQRFQEQIVDSFVADYAAGLTPSPCLRCNPLIKFAALLEQCSADDDMIATGHYVIKNFDQTSGYYYLTCGPEAKDQSYFLCLLTQAQLSRCLFPLAARPKDQVRQMARERGLCSADKKDSFDVCFVPSGDYRELLKQRGVADKPGEMADSDGRVVGLHSGLSNYTIGQRRGLEVALGYPAYVLELDGERNRLVVGRREELYAASARLSGCVFQSMPKPNAPFHCLIRVRHKAKLSGATLYPEQERGQDAFRLEFDAPEWGLTPGQYAAFYQGDRLLGGGRFER